MAKLRKLSKVSFEQGWKEAKAYYLGTQDVCQQQIEELAFVGVILEQGISKDAQPLERSVSPALEDNPIPPLSNEVGGSEAEVIPHV